MHSCFSALRLTADQWVARRAYIEARDPFGNTPLLLSISGGTADIAVTLLERGADVSATRRDGETALTLAKQLGNQQLVRLVEFKLLETSIRAQIRGA